MDFSVIIESLISGRFSVQSLKSQTSGFDSSLRGRVVFAGAPAESQWLNVLAEQHEHNPSSWEAIKTQADRKSKQIDALIQAAK